MVVTAGGIKAGDYSAIPQNIRTALKGGNYSESIAEQMCGLPTVAMEQLVAYVAYEIEDIRMGYKGPIIRAAYFGTNVPTDLLLAYSSTSISPPEIQGMTVIPVVASGSKADFLSELMYKFGAKKPENEPSGDSDRLDDA